MKKPFNPVIPDYTPKSERKEQVVQLEFQPCIHCGKKIGDGYYARYNSSGVCSKKCMIEQDKKPKYPGHTEEDYFRNLGETFDVDGDILESGE